MIGETYNPLERFENEFKDSFQRNASVYFDELVKKSGVDAELNRRLVNEYKALTAEAEAADRKHSWLVFWVVVLVFALITSGITAFYGFGEEENGFIFLWIVGTLFSIMLLITSVRAMKKVKALRDEKRQAAEQKKDEAMQQMASLNRLYTWDIAARIFEKTVPDIHFDRFSNEARFSQFVQEFGWSGQFDEDSSILFAQSGELADNPFAFCRLLSMYWGTETYTGSITIHWTTRERSSDGKYYTRHHSEVLTASVTKPKPEYYHRALLIYGNEAAPHLNFKRECSGLAQAGDGFFGSLKVRHERKKLEKLSRNLTDNSNYTMMANKEFETLFNTMDRDNEVDFRIMFTPMAQLQMTQLLKNTAVGYGDDFSFKKMNKINVIESKHLNETDLDTCPTRFVNFDLEESRKFFLDWNCQLFKSLYFTMAPILAIPVYMQTLPQSKLQAYPELALNSANIWECEALANYMGESKFAHPKSITHNILKVNDVKHADGVGSISVVAHGHYTQKHTEYVSKFGGDGKIHTIPVNWLEYIPISRESNFTIREMPGEDELQVRKKCQPSEIFRRNIIAFFRK